MIRGGRNSRDRGSLEVASKVEDRTKGLKVSLALENKQGTRVAEEATKEGDQMVELDQIDQGEDPSSLA